MSKLKVETGLQVLANIMFHPASKLGEEKKSHILHQI